MNYFATSMTRLQFLFIYVFVLLAFAGMQVQAQPGRQVKNLVFEGEGLRGIAYCGAIRPLEEQGKYFGWYRGLVIDGGLTGNFPIRMFDSTRDTDPAAQNMYVSNPGTIAFRIDRDEQIAKDKLAGSLAPMPIRNVKEYSNSLYNIVIEKLNRQSLSADDWKRTVSVSDGKIGPRIRRLSKTEIATLMENGPTATKNYLQLKQE